MRLRCVSKITFYFNTNVSVNKETSCLHISINIPLSLSKMFCLLYLSKSFTELWAGEQNDGIACICPQMWPKSVPETASDLQIWKPLSWEHAKSAQNVITMRNAGYFILVLLALFVHALTYTQKWNNVLLLCFMLPDGDLTVSLCVTWKLSLTPVEKMLFITYMNSLSSGTRSYC